MLWSISVYYFCLILISYLHFPTPSFKSMSKVAISFSTSVVWACTEKNSRVKNMCLKVTLSEIYLPSRPNNWTAIKQEIVRGTFVSIFRLVLTTFRRWCEEWTGGLDFAVSLQWILVAWHLVTYCVLKHSQVRPLRSPPARALPFPLRPWSGCSHRSGNITIRSGLVSESFLCTFLWPLIKDTT